MSAKIGIFPASGGLGTSIITHLLKLVPASNLILVARFPEKLAELSRAGATVRRGDYDDSASLDRVFDGVGVLMLISYASIELDYRAEVRCITHAICSELIGAVGPQKSYRPGPPKWRQTHHVLLPRLWRGSR